jgi:hypothetical protein
LKVGKHIYIYEVEGFRNADGKPRNKKHPVGKVDQETGEEVFKKDFYPKLPQYGRTAPVHGKGGKKELFSVNYVKTPGFRGKRILEKNAVKRIVAQGCFSCVEGSKVQAAWTPLAAIILGAKKLLRPYQRVFGAGRGLI